MIEGVFMDLLKEYGPKELGRLTYRKYQEKRNKKKRDVDNYIADRKRAHYSKLNDSRKKLKVW